jgi:hypothetical protein
MKIKLFPEAASQYVRRCYKGMPASAYGLHNEAYCNLLEQVNDKWLDVETDFLFSDQFNTAPIEGVSVNGLRVMWTEVEFIEGDIRPGRVLDQWTNCHYAANEIPAECMTEERKKYLNLFKTPISRTKQELYRGVKLYLKELFPKNEK